MARHQWEEFNCYEVLEIPRDASPSKIHKAYIRASKVHHPDVGGSEEAQKRVNLAYEVLSDPIQRNSHDAVWVRTARRRAGPAPQGAPQPRSATRPRSTRAEQAPREEYKQARPVSLGGLRSRIEGEIETQRSSIWADLDQRSENLYAQFQEKHRQNRQSILVWVLVLAGLLVFVGQFPILWIGVIVFAYLLVSALSGASIEGKTFSPFRPGAYEALREHARNRARESCSTDVSKLDRHYQSLASLSELLLRSSTFDDSEEQVARRLAAAFFLMGYMPESYDRDARMLIFTDGDQRIAVRFRHRTGAATNIAYVKRLVRLMSMYRAPMGFLFCTPGLSANGSRYAAQNRVKWYSLEKMNSWIDEVLRSDYAGPKGNVLSNLDRLQGFIRSIAKPIPRRTRRYRRWG